MIGWLNTQIIRDQRVSQAAVGCWLFACVVRWLRLTALVGLHSRGFWLVLSVFGLLHGVHIRLAVIHNSKGVKH